MRTEHRLLVGAGIALALVASGLESSASAFCRTSTQGLRDGCTITANECCTAGKPLFWKNVCVSYSIHEQASTQMGFDVASEAFRRGFATWSDAKCAATGETPSITAYELAATPVTAVEYNKDGPNVHVIVFRDASWPHSDADNTLSLTTLTFNPDDGEIFDADMEVNSAQQTFATADPVPGNGFDFASVVVHEAGHFLGLAHSPEPEATMFAHYKPGSTTMRTLTDDDTSGICAAYPPNATRNTGAGLISADACDPTPRHGLQTEPNGTPVQVSHGCATTPGDASSAPSLVTAALGMLALLGVARRRRRA
jgi:MYXO-CTERM domain-containing protein